MKSNDIKKGDRVAAYLPNIPETVIAYISTSVLGAIWSSCSPDFGTKGVIDRFSQITPKILFFIIQVSCNYSNLFIMRIAKILK